MERIVSPLKLVISACLVSIEKVEGILPSRVNFREETLYTQKVQMPY
jgi:hypothetical protein